MAEIASTCPYCGCGCGVYLHTSGDRVTGVAPSRSHPVSQGRLCLKGWHAHELMHNPARLTTPLVRSEGELRRASWEEAIAAAAAGLRKVDPSAVGVLGSARAANEDDYVLARFARGTLGTANLDCSARLQSPARLSSGDLADLDRSDLILLLGADPNEEHPAVSARIYRALQRDAKLIVASMRKHELARLADIFFRMQPGAELHLVGALTKAVLREANPAEAGRAGLAELRASLAGAGAEAAGVSPEDLQSAARTYAIAKQVTIVFSPALAVTPTAEAAIMALGNLAGLGELESLPRVALLALVGRNNLQGCLDMGVSPLFLPGRRPLDEAERFSSSWGGTVNAERGLAAWEMLGQVQALYVMGDDVLRAAPDRRAAEEALSQVPFVIVQDLFLTPACQQAEVVLPAAAFGEREGTFTNFERRVQRIRRAAAPPGEAREDWRIIAELSRALGKPMPYESAADVFAEIALLLPPYRGLNYPVLEQWGGARASVERPSPRLQPLSLNGGAVHGDEEHPFVLVAEATLGPWDEEITTSNTLTVGVEFTVTSRDFPGGMLALHPEDAARLGVRAGRNVQVTSARGQCTLRVQISEEASEGVALVPYWHATRLQLLEIVSCPESGRPALAPTPVSIAPA